MSSPEQMGESPEQLIKYELKNVEKENSEILELKKISEQVKNLAVLDDRDSLQKWSENRKTLKHLVNKEIKQIDEDEKNSPKEKIEKIAMMKFNYLWQPKMINHVSEKGLKNIIRICKEGLITSDFRQRANKRGIDIGERPSYRNWWR
jgi:hypothetical protein